MWLRLLHNLGLTDLSDEEVAGYYQKQETLRQAYLAAKRGSPTLLALCQRYSPNPDQLHFLTRYLSGGRNVVGATQETFPVREWEEITAHKLGEIEGNIKGLVRVIIAAHRVEEPTNALRQAVKKNLESNVEYRFLVSQSHAESEIDGWIRMFLAIAHVVLKRTGSELEPADLVRISNLQYDWRDTPYVFYQTETSNGKMATIAFRGDETDEGIAKRYTRLPGWLAYSMALAILSDAPVPLTVEEEQFQVSPEIDSAALTLVSAEEEEHEHVA